MNVPGSPKLHIWLGLIIALLGTFVGGYAYTGDRAYHLEFILVAVLGFALIVAGGTLAAHGQASRPRLGGKKAQGEDEEEDEPSFVDRVKAQVAAWTGSNPGNEEDQAASDAEPVQATVKCPDCSNVFETTGQAPFEASCPECGHEDTVEVPA